MTVVVCSNCRAVNDNPGELCQSCGEPIHRRAPAAVLSAAPVTVTADPEATNPEAPAADPAEPARSDIRQPIRIVSAGEIPRVVVPPAPTPGRVKPDVDDSFRPGPEPGRCRRCDRVNPTELWFCVRCGEPLRVLPTARAPRGGGRRPSTPTPTGLVSPSGKIRKGAFRRAMHRSGPRRRWVIRYDRPLATKVLAFRAFLAAVGVAIALGAVLPSASPLRIRAEQPFEGKLQAVPVRSATIAPANALVAGHPPRDAVDGNPKSAWMVGWDLGPVQENDHGACSETRIPADASLIVTFPKAEKLVRVSIAAGETSPGQVQPRVADLAFSDGTCTRLTLADTRATQTFKLSTGAVDQVTLDLVAAFPPPGSLAQGEAGQAEISVRSIEFFHRS
ncbi:MAG: hypothetical protein FWC87_08705 [Acidimicrobiaceae bacterium]|nr:hypothetical protein [Acidimicrobiaceae bacterium]